MVTTIARQERERLVTRIKNKHQTATEHIVTVMYNTEKPAASLALGAIRSDCGGAGGGESGDWDGERRSKHEQILSSLRGAQLGWGE